MEPHATVHTVMTTTTDSSQARRARRTLGRPSAYLSVNQPEAVKIRKKGLRGRRNLLETLDSAKENPRNPLIPLGRAWVDLVRFGEIWPRPGKMKLPACAAPLADAAMICNSAAPRGRGATGSEFVPTVNATGAERLPWAPNNLACHAAAAFGGRDNPSWIKGSDRAWDDPRRWRPPKRTEI
jgi:hypothetical protein